MRRGYKTNIKRGASIVIKQRINLKANLEDGKKFTTKKEILELYETK